MKTDLQSNVNKSLKVSVKFTDFTKIIPNKAALLEFFENKCQKYLPPKKELTLKFLR